MIKPFIVEKYLEDKFKINENYIDGKVYEIRVEHDISEQDINEFLRLAKTKLENLDYQIYFTGEKFKYDDRIITVQSNEYFIAIKRKGEDVKYESTEGTSNRGNGIIKKYRNKHWK